jgi:hypothetical protein
MGFVGRSGLVGGVRDSWGAQCPDVPWGEVWFGPGQILTVKRPRSIREDSLPGPGRGICARQFSHIMDRSVGITWTAPHSSGTNDAMKIRMAEA